MGCSQSSDTAVITPPEPAKMSVDNNANTTNDGGADKERQEESAALERFQTHLMTQLMSIANEPPMQPMSLVEGDPRMILIPAIFQCKATLAELQTTPLPANSNLLVTYLKSGTHWLWEIMKMLRKGQAILDGIPKEMGHLEFFPPSTLKEINGKELSVYATHFPLWTLPVSSYQNLKTVYCMRNPKDVCVSMYYHFISMSEANPKAFPAMTFDEFFMMFLGPSPANIMGSWFDHVADYWDNHRSNPDILCVTFEDMKKNPMEQIKRIDSHIGSNASEELLEQIVKVSQFKSLKEQKASSEKPLEIVFKGSMYRKGEVGDWKHHMSGEQIAMLDKMISDWQNERAEPVPLVYEL